MTVTETGPSVAEAGLVTVIEVSLLTVMAPAAVPFAVLPNFTEVAPVNPLPVIVTELPPAFGPEVGEMPVTDGTAVYRNALCPVAVPPIVVTWTSAVPLVAEAGLIAVTVTRAGNGHMSGRVPANYNSRHSRQEIPVITTDVPPDTGPVAGEIRETVGAAVYVYLSPVTTAVVPLGVVTLTSTIPTVPAGGVTVIDVLVFARRVPWLLPKYTAIGLFRAVPVIVTAGAALNGPPPGVTLTIAGTAEYVYLSSATIADVPPMVAMVTSTVPAIPAGVFTVIDVALSAVMVPAALPNFTEVAPFRPLPEMVTVVPTVSGQAAGAMRATVGTDELRILVSGDDR